MAKHMLILAKPFRRALYLHMHDGGWLIIIVIALLFVIWVRSRYKASHATQSPDLSQITLIERQEHPVSTPRDDGASSARVPLILVAETVPKSPSKPAETEKDQILASCMSLRAEISECNTLNDRLRNRLDSKDVKISKLQIQLMENPTREILELQLETKETVIASLTQQLQALKEDYEYILRTQQENLKRQNKNDELYASAIADLKSTYHDMIEANRFKHQTDVHELNIRCGNRIDESDRRATEAFSRCEQLEAKVVEIQTAHDRLVKRERERKVEREHEESECFDQIQLARESELAVRDQLKYLKGMVNTQDESIESLEAMINIRDENVRILQEMIQTKDENIEDLKRTSTEQQNQQENIVSLARIDGRLQAAAALQVYMKLARKARTRMRSEIKNLQDDVTNKTAEIQASEASHAEDLALALNSQKNDLKTSSVELGAVSNELRECQTRSKKIQSDWEAAHKQVSELVQLLCEKESLMRDKNAELEAEKENSIELERRLALAQGRAEKIEEKQSFRKMEEQALPIEDSWSHHSTILKASPSLPVSMRDNEMANKTTSTHVDVVEVPRSRCSVAQSTKVPVAGTNTPAIKKETNVKKAGFIPDTFVDKNINRLGDSLNAPKWINAYDSKAMNQVRTLGGRTDEGRADKLEKPTSSIKQRQTTKGSKQASAQLPQWLIDSMQGKVEKEMSKETTYKAAGPQEKIREYGGVREKIDDRSQRRGSKWSSHQSKEEGKMSESLPRNQQQQIADDTKRAPGQFPQWLIDARKQIEEEVQKETDDKLASAQENLRRHEELHGKIDDRFQKKGSQKKPMSL